MTLHWIAIFPAALLGFMVGGLWYGPPFGRAWAAARGLEGEPKRGANMALIFALTFLLNLFSAAVLDHVYTTYGGPGLQLSLLIAFGIALGFIVPSMGVNYLFSRMKLTLFLIDAGYWLVIYLLMGALLFYLR